MSILDRKLEPKDGEVFKFMDHGDRIYAEFILRETRRTKKQDAAPVLHCNIIESRVSECDGPTGLHTIFESSGVTQVLDEARLQIGEHFVLQFCSTNEKTRYKKFALEKAPPPDDDYLAGDEPPLDGDDDGAEPPDDLK
jgi:hypothetical protein